MDMEDVAIVCLPCNTTKGARSMQEFIDYCRMIVERHA